MGFRNIVASFGLIGAIAAAEAGAAEVKTAEVPVIANSRILSPGNGISYVNRMDFDANSVKRYGFNQVYKLRKNDVYTGNADRVMLVWSRTQLLEAEQFRKAHYSGLKTDIVVCENPNVQRAQLEKKSPVIYHRQ